MRIYNSLTDKLEEFKKFNLKAKESLRRLEETYKQHIS